jgi:hypothetical protein
MSVVDVDHLNITMDLLYTVQPEENLSLSQPKQEHMPGRRSCSTIYTARGESFLVTAKAGAHARQAQLFHQVSMSVVDVDHLNRTMDLLYTA